MTWTAPRRSLILAAAVAAATLVVVVVAIFSTRSSTPSPPRSPVRDVPAPSPVPLARRDQDVPTVAVAPATGLIAFVGESDGSGHGSEIYVVAADGTGLRALTSTPDDPFVGELAPTWSPDRRRLAFLRVLPGGAGTQLVVLDPATGEEQFEDRIPLGTVAGAISVAWSPDGRFIIVHVANGGPSPVLMDLETASWIRMSPESPVTAWSPDGNWLLVHPCTGPPSAWCEDDEPLLVPADVLGTNEVFSYLDVPGVRPLRAQVDTTEWPDGFWAPTWHPDGSSVAITTHRDQTIDRSASAPMRRPSMSSQSPTDVSGR